MAWNQISTKTKQEDTELRLKKLDRTISKLKKEERLIPLAKSYEEKAETLESSSLGASIKYYEKALNIYTKFKNAEAVGTVRNKLQSLYFDLHDYESSLAHNYALLEMYQVANDSSNIMRIYVIIASLYDNLHDEKKSYNFHFKALQWAEALKSKKGMAAIANNIAGLFSDMDSLEHAFKYLRLAESLNIERKDTNWLAVNHSLYAKLYRKTGQYDSARYYMDKSVAYFNENGNSNDSIYSLRELGIYYLDVDSMQLAERYFNSGVLLSRRIGNLRAEANFNHWLSEMHERSGDEVLSKLFLELRYDLLDSVNSIKKAQVLEEFEVLYDLQNLEHALDVSLAAKETAEQKSKLISFRFKAVLILSLILVLIGTTTTILYRRQRQAYHHLLKLNIVSTGTDKREEKKYAGSNLSEEKKQTILNNLISLMVDEALFKEPDLKLESIADKLDVSRSYISQVINETYDQSFTAYINTHRINLAKKHLIDKAYDKYSIEGIAQMVGFKSLSAFNSWFKKLTGLPPSYYRKRGREML